MKYHFIYFIIIPILLFIALLFPLTIREYEDGTKYIANGLDDIPSAIIFIVPTIIATVLLLIRNRVTAIIGTCFFILTFGISGFMNYVIRFEMYDEIAGIGTIFIFIIMLFAVITSLIHTIKLMKTRDHKSKDHEDLLDTI